MYFDQLTLGQSGTEFWFKVFLLLYYSIQWFICLFHFVLKFLTAHSMLKVSYSLHRGLRFLVVLHKVHSKQAEKLKNCKMKDEWRMMYNEGWRMMISSCWGVLQTDWLTYGHLWSKNLTTKHSVYCQARVQVQGLSQISNKRPGPGACSYNCNVSTTTQKTFLSRIKSKSLHVWTD